MYTFAWGGLRSLLLFHKIRVFNVLNASGALLSKPVNLLYKSIDWFLYEDITGI